MAQPDAKPWFEDVPAPRRVGNRNDQLAKELEAASGKKLEDFPFDPKARSEDLEGLEKLRAVPEPLRQTIWDFHWLGVARENNGDAQRERLEARNAWLAREKRKLLKLADECFSGHRGRAAQEVARTFLIDPQGRRRTDVHSLEALRDELNRMKPRKK